VRVRSLFAVFAAVPIAGGAASLSSQSLSVGPWDVPDTIRTHCASQPVAGACPWADTSVLVYDDDEAIRLVFRRDNPCGWSPRAAWTRSRDTIRVTWSFAGERTDVPCPAHVHWDAWQTRIAPLVAGPYVVNVYLAGAHGPPQLISARSILLNAPDPIPMAPPSLVRVARDALCVTNGEITTLTNGRLSIATASSRAVVQIATAPSVAEIRFQYLGPSESAKPLASGEMRRQIGLKLRAQDQCNLLYVMWHIEPDAKFGVSVKRNPGQSTHEQCDAHGYVTIRPRVSTTLPQIKPGESHTLRAALDGDALTVTADGRVVWNGPVGNGIADIDGPVGLRTDNARFVFDYFVRPPAPGGASSTPVNGRTNRCEPSPGD
jgi:hypothetical protein